MNLTPIFVTDFDHNGWPLCPICHHELHRNNITRESAGCWNKELILHGPLKCGACDWSTPTQLDPKLTINLAQGICSTQIQWRAMPEPLPRIKQIQARFEGKALDWEVRYGAN